MAREFEGSVQFVGVGSADGEARLRSFVERHGVDLFPHAADPGNDLRSALGVLGQPTWWFVNGEDGAVEQVFGELGRAGLTDRVRALVQT